MAKQKSNKITIANIVSMIGLVLLLVFTFIGHSYKSGGELGWDILISLGISGLTFFLLWFLIKAKTAENNLKKWKIAEFSSLAFYVLFSVGTAIFCGFTHFFVVNENKEEIKKYASSDLDKVENLFEDYYAFESDAISTTATGLRNATSKGQLWDAKLTEFMRENEISRTRASASNFETIQKNILIDSGYSKYYDTFSQQKSDILNVVQSWNAMMIPTQAKRIEEIASDVETELTNLSIHANLPIIFMGSSGKHTIGEYQKKEFKINDGIESFQFRKSIRDTTGFSFAAILVVILIHCLILFNYFAAFRTSTLDIKIEEDGGQIL